MACLTGKDVIFSRGKLPRDVTYWVAPSLKTTFFCGDLSRSMSHIFTQDGPFEDIAIAVDNPARCHTIVGNDA